MCICCGIDVLVGHTGNDQLTGGAGGDTKLILSNGTKVLLEWVTGLGGDPSSLLALSLPAWV